MENASAQDYRNCPNELLRKERHLRGWSLKDVADRISCPDVRLIRRWESGNVFPSPAYRQKLCQLFEKNTDELGLIRTRSTRTKKPLKDNQAQEIHLVEAARVSTEHSPPSIMADKKEAHITSHDDAQRVVQRAMQDDDSQYAPDRDATLLVYGIIIGMSLGSLVRNAQ